VLHCNEHYAATRHFYVATQDILPRGRLPQDFPDDSI